MRSGSFARGGRSDGPCTLGAVAAITTFVVTSVSFLDGDAEAANGDGEAPNGDKALSDAKGEGDDVEGESDDATAGADPAEDDGVAPDDAEGDVDGDAVGLGLPVSSAAAGDGVSSDPARHVASTSNVGEARCMRQR